MPPARVLVSCDPEFEAQALQEIREILPGIPLPAWLDDGLALFTPDLPFGDFAVMLHQRAPIFVRHIASVQREVALCGDERDIETLLAVVEELGSSIDPTQSFAVQSRIVGEGKLPYRKFILNNTLSERLKARTGAAMECSAPHQIVSVLCTPARGYIGVSLAEQNRSAWPGGEHRFKRDAQQISRAEFKLLEAFSVFGLHLPSSGVALDLGAAPGGWTRVLRQRGMRVVAVDPGDLDARFRHDSGTTHVRKKAEEYLPAVKARYDLLVNDMRMDALDSAEIMLRASDCLLPGAVALLTLKLPQAPKNDPLEIARSALARLTRVYRLLGARQLYHNRSEVTAALRFGTAPKKYV